MTVKGSVSDTYAVVQSRAVLETVRQDVTHARHDIDRRDARVVDKVPALGHRLVRVHVELAVAECGRVQENLEVLLRVLLGVEAEALGWPAYNMRSACNTQRRGSETDRPSA